MQKIILSLKNKRKNMKMKFAIILKLNKSWLLKMMIYKKILLILQKKFKRIKKTKIKMYI